MKIVITCMFSRSDTSATDRENRRRQGQIWEEFRGFISLKLMLYSWTLKM